MEGKETALNKTLDEKNELKGDRARKDAVTLGIIFHILSALYNSPFSLKKLKQKQ